MPLDRIGFVPLQPGDEAGFDHADVHAPGRRMYVAHTGANRVDVVDCADQRYVRSLPDLPGVAGVLIEAPDDLLFTSDRGCARVSVFRCPDEELLGQVAVGPHPNGLAYDRAGRRLYSFNLGEPLGEDCKASVVDLDRFEVVAELPLPGRPRWAVYDEERRVVYANVRDPASIVVIDCGRVEIVRAYEIPSDGPHGLWLDGTRLLCAADGGRLVALDRDSGVVLQSLPLPGIPDVVWHDPHLRRLYVAVGEPGVVCTFSTDGELTQVGTTGTETGAHTLTVDPVSHYVYVFCPDSGGAAVYAPG
jgi:DNA-binding beta-propeller fold protein YncE